MWARLYEASCALRLVRIRICDDFSMSCEKKAAGRPRSFDFGSATNCTVSSPFVFVYASADSPHCNLEASDSYEARAYKDRYTVLPVSSTRRTSRKAQSYCVSPIPFLLLPIAYCIYVFTSHSFILRHYETNHSHPMSGFTAAADTLAQEPSQSTDLPDAPIWILLTRSQDERTYIATWHASHG